jgi:hypothetical protein
LLDFWRGFDEVGREDYIEGAVEHHLNEWVKVDNEVIDHGSDILLNTIPQPALDLCWFLLMFFIVNTLKMGEKQKDGPN